VLAGSTQEVVVRYLPSKLGRETRTLVLCESTNEFSHTSAGDVLSSPQLMTGSPELELQGRALSQSHSDTFDGGAEPKKKTRRTQMKGFYSPTQLVQFPPTPIGGESISEVRLCNASQRDFVVTVQSITPPFAVDPKVRATSPLACHNVVH